MQFQQKGNTLSQEVICLLDIPPAPRPAKSSIEQNRSSKRDFRNPRFRPSPGRLKRPFSTIILHLVTEAMPATQIHRVLKMVIWSKM